MRLDEITDEDKVYMGYKGINYSFDRELAKIKHNLQTIGNSSAPQIRRAIIKTYTNELKHNIEKFIEECKLQNIPNIDNDEDVIKAKSVYNEILYMRGEI
jgi:hypothetical protein